MSKNIYFSTEEAKEIAGDIYAIKSHFCDSVECPVVIFVAGQMGYAKTILRSAEVQRFMYLILKMQKAPKMMQKITDHLRDLF